MEELKQQILDFLNSDEDNTLVLDLPMMPINDIEEIIKPMGYDILESDTNGWQMDFWYYYTNDTRKICLSGSLQYGNFKLNFEKL